MKHGDPPETLLRLRELRLKLERDGVLKAVDDILDPLIPASPALLRGNDKIVKDPVWGVITIPNFLVPLVDSRLLQRQRRIRQLGLSYLVYPAAGYSRFEHALGCCHVMSQLLDSVQKRKDWPFKVPQHRYRQVLLGALVHDIGHMPFSHASEECIQQAIDDMQIGDMHLSEISYAVNEATGSKTLRMAEILSVLIIISSRFSRLWSMTQKKPKTSFWR